MDVLGIVMSVAVAYLLLGFIWFGIELHEQPDRNMVAEDYVFYGSAIVPLWPLWVVLTIRWLRAGLDPWDPDETGQKVLLLAAELGMKETRPQRRLHLKILRAWHKNRFQLADRLLEEYQSLAAELIDRLSDDERPKAQIGLILAKAAMLWRARRWAWFDEELDDALTYARNMGYDDLAFHLGLFERRQPRA